MNYKKVSFFDKYNIDINTPPNQIMAKFLTDPSKRKDLPAVNKILKDNEKLFEEALFSQKEDKTITDDLNRVNLLISFEKSLNDLSIENLKTFFNYYNKVEESKELLKNMYYGKLLGDRIEPIIEEFFRLFIEEIIKNFVEVFENIDAEVATYLIDKINNTNLIDQLDDAVSRKIELMLSKIENDKLLQNNLVFISKLPKKFLERENIRNAIIYYIKKSFEKNDNSEFVNKNLTTVFSLLSADDLEKENDFIVSLGKQLSNGFDFKDISKEQSALKNYIKNVKWFALRIKSNIKKDLLEVVERCDFLLSLINTSSFKNKCQVLKTHSNDINALCEIVDMALKIGLNKNTASFFSGKLMILTNLNQQVEKIINDANRMKGNYNLYVLGSMGKDLLGNYAIDGEKLARNVINGLNPIDIDEVLAIAYIIYVLDSKRVSYDSIKGILNLAFSGVDIIELVPENGFFGILTPKGLFLKNYLKCFPSAWEIFDGQTVRKFLLSKFDYDHYKDSIFIKCKEKYSYLINSIKNNTIQTETIKILNEINKEKEICKKINILIKKGEYEDALKYINALKHFKFDKKIVNNIEIKLTEKKYVYAQELIEKEEYDKASEILEGLGDYKKSKEKIKLIKTLKKEKEYNKAVALIKKGDFAVAKSILINLRGFKPEIAELIQKCENGIKEQKYNNAISLMENGEYIKALLIFNELLGFKADIQEKIVICEKKMNEEAFNNAVKLFEDKKYQEAEIIFKRLKDKGIDKADKYVYECRAQIDLEDKKKKINLLIKKHKYNKALGLLSKIDKKEDGVDELKTQIKKARFNFFATIASVAAIVIIIIISCVSSSIKASNYRRELYEDLLLLVEETDGNMYVEIIEEDLAVYNKDYDYTNLAVKYYNKRLNFIINNYDPSYDKEIDAILHKNYCYEETVKIIKMEMTYYRLKTNIVEGKNLYEISFDEYANLDDNYKLAKQFKEKYEEKLIDNELNKSIDNLSNIYELVKKYNILNLEVLEKIIQKEIKNYSADNSQKDRIEEYFSRLDALKLSTEKQEVYKQLKSEMQDINAAVKVLKMHTFKQGEDFSNTNAAINKLLEYSKKEWGIASSLFKTIDIRLLIVDKTWMSSDKTIGFYWDSETLWRDGIAPQYTDIEYYYMYSLSTTKIGFGYSRKNGSQFKAFLISDFYIINGKKYINWYDEINKKTYVFLGEDGNVL